MLQTLPESFFIYLGNSHCLSLRAEFVFYTPRKGWGMAHWLCSWWSLNSECMFLLTASVQFSSVTQSCPTLCDPMNCSTPGLPVYHDLPEFTQTHVHRVSDAIQPSHPLSSPSPLAPNPPNIRVFSNESTLRMRWPKFLSSVRSKSKIYWAGL